MHRKRDKIKQKKERKKIKKKKLIDINKSMNECKYQSFQLETMYMNQLRIYIAKEN